MGKGPGGWPARLRIGHDGRGKGYGKEIWQTVNCIWHSGGTAVRGSLPEWLSGRQSGAASGRDRDLRGQRLRAGAGRDGDSCPAGEAAGQKGLQRRAGGDGHGAAGTGQTA